MNEWQPIETAPKHDKLKDSVNILVFRGDEGFEEKIITIENSINYRYYKCNGFIHWMPLPNPPIRKGDSMSKTTKADKLRNETEKPWEINEGRFHE